MKGYQKGYTGAFRAFVGPNIHGPYVDGVRITRASPWQHIWTFSVGLQKNFHHYYPAKCPCVLGSTHSPRSFFGSDYFCESGCPSCGDFTNFYAADPCGMEKCVVLLKQSTVQLLVCHGSTKSLMLPPLTTLRWGCVLMNSLLMRMSWSLPMRFMSWVYAYLLLDNAVWCYM